MPFDKFYALVLQIISANPEYLADTKDRQFKAFMRFVYIAALAAKNPQVPNSLRADDKLNQLMAQRFGYKWYTKLIAWQAIVLLIEPLIKHQFESALGQMAKYSHWEISRDFVKLELAVGTIEFPYCKE